jgi:glyoxylase-like metal-dependent hydrolase (beta-lactamase superfamily II)
MPQLDKLPSCSGLAGDEYHIYSLCYGRSSDRRVFNAFIMPGDFHDGPMPIDYNVWVVENAERRLIVDLGFSPQAARRHNRVLVHDPVAALEAIGIPAGDVTDIVLTHLHCDHAGNIDRFPNAMVHIQDSEVSFATGRCMCEDRLNFVFELDDVLNIVRKNFGKQLAFHDGDEPLFPGVTLHKLLGHTNGLQAVRVNTPRGQVLLASDATHFFPNAYNQNPYPVTIDVAASIASYRKMFAIVSGPDFLIPGHDPKIRTIYPKLVVNGVVLHVLHESPTETEVGFFKSVENYLADYPLEA